ncbi:MAG: hypothetical protein KC486_12230, partial [Myxococcales bacterium]|nr:hypothetical protein [Myxococcales bacterium]
MIDALLADLDEVLTCFVDQESDGTLLIACDQVAGPIVTLAIDGVDQRHPHDLGVAFPGSFSSAAEYIEKILTAVVDGLAAAEAEAAAAPDLVDDDFDDPHDLGGGGVDTGDLDEEARRALTEQHLAAAKDPARPPAARLLDLCEALRLHVPASDGRLLLGVVPSVIDDLEGYAALAGELVHARLPGLRLVLREPPVPVSELDPALADACVHRHELPLTPQTFVDSANALADDPAAPRQQRTTALLQVAFHDLGHGNNDGAERRFGELIDLFVGDEAEVDDTSDTGAGSASEAAADHDSHPTANDPIARASSDSEAVDDHHAAVRHTQREARSTAEPAPPDNAASEESEPAAPPFAPADAVVLALALYGLGELRLQEGDHAAALDRLIVAWRTLADDAPPVLRHMVAAALMKTTVALQRPREARVFAASAAESAIRAQSPESAAQALCTHGDLDRELGDLEAA